MIVFTPPNQVFTPPNQVSFEQVMNV